MAALTPLTPRSGHLPDFLRSENENPASPTRPSSMPSGSKTLHGHSRRGHLQNLDVGALQNIQQAAVSPSNISTSTPCTAPADTLTSKSKLAEPSFTASATPDSLANDLSKFHICSPGRDDDPPIETTPGRKSATDLCSGCTSLPASPIPTDTSSPGPPPLQPQEAFSPKEISASPVEHEHLTDLITAPDLQDTLEKHVAGGYDWVLSLPHTTDKLATGLGDSVSQGKASFGCNLLQKTSVSQGCEAGHIRAINKYTMIATPLTGAADQRTSAGPERADKTPVVARTLLLPDGTVPANDALTTGLSPRVQGIGPDALSRSRSHSTPRSPGSAVSRIEDTLEELDKLEDEFEAVKQMVHVERVPSPEKAERPKEGSGANTGKPNISVVSSVKKQAAAKMQASVPASKTSGNATSTANKRLSVARPVSLLPPKPLAKSTKPSTRPAFELPGEAVARRLKEQREARMAAAAVGNATAAAPVSRKTRTSIKPKPPTIPTFELPGEAISRRKREEHQAKIKQQEEDERKRREFKAKPIRFSITPSTLPRETISSRARTNRASVIGPGEFAAAGAGTPANTNKRLSVVSSASSNLSASQKPVSRGRDSALGSSSTATHQSRATSTSTGSVGGQRNSVSVDATQQQKLRGRDILQRDNLLSADRDRARRERETAAKLARQEAAERSRALSREWAERQRMRAKRASMMPTS